MSLWTVHKADAVTRIGQLEKYRDRDALKSPLLLFLFVLAFAMPH